MVYLVQLVNQEYDTTVFGVISSKEELDDDGYRTYRIGNFGTLEKVWR